MYFNQNYFPQKNGLPLLTASEIKIKKKKKKIHIKIVIVLPFIRDFIFMRASIVRTRILNSFLFHYHLYLYLNHRPFSILKI